jgi:hypothetical protein
LEVTLMRTEQLCVIDIRYTSTFHLVRPYGNESGLGWGIGEGTVTGERLSGSIVWSNHPSRRGDGVMLPNLRGVITTGDGAEVLCDMSGRTIFEDGADGPVGSQLLVTLLEAEDSRYAWLNHTVCLSEGVFEPARGTAHFDVHVCHNTLLL